MVQARICLQDKIVDTVSDIDFAGHVPHRRPLPHNSRTADRKKAAPANEGRVDRRVRRTRNLLRHALVKLIPEKGYPAITVEDICEAADIGRSTFYARYADKDDLTKRTIREQLQTVRSARIDRRAETEAYGFAFSRPMFEHAQAFQAVHRALTGDVGEAMHEEFRVWMTETVRREIVARDRTGTVPVELTERFVVGAFLAVLSWWLDKEPERPIDEVEAMFQRLALGGIAGS